MKYFLHHDDLPKEVYIGSSIAIDTETTGLNLVRDRLCLIQICTCLLYTSDAADE